MLKAKEKLLQDGFGFEILNWPFVDSGSDILFNSSNYLKSKIEKGTYLSKAVLGRKDVEIASLIISRKDDEVIIGYKSSFGFLDTIEKLGFQKTELFIGAILEYLMESGMKSLYWKHFPKIYSADLNAIIIQALLNFGFIIDGSSINFYLESKNEFETLLAPDTQRRLMKIEKSELLIQVLNKFDSSQFFKALVKWRKDREIPMNIDESQIQSNIENFPNKYQLYKVYDETKLIAFSLGVKISKDVYYQYLPAHDPNYDHMSPVILITKKMLEYAKNDGMKYLDLGIASEMNGEENYGLIKFKEKLGSSTCMKYTFYKEFK